MTGRRKVVVAGGDTEKGKLVATGWGTVSETGFFTSSDPCAVNA